MPILPASIGSDTHWHRFGSRRFSSLRVVPERDQSVAFRILGGGDRSFRNVVVDCLKPSQGAPWSTAVIRRSIAPLATPRRTRSSRPIMMIMRNPWMPRSRSASSYTVVLNWSFERDLRDDPGLGEQLFAGRPVLAVRGMDAGRRIFHRDDLRGPVACLSISERTSVGTSHVERPVTRCERLSFVESCTDKSRSRHFRPINSRPGIARMKCPPSPTKALIWPATIASQASTVLRSSSRSGAKPNCLASLGASPRLASRSRRSDQRRRQSASGSEPQVFSGAVTGIRPIGTIR